MNVVDVNTANRWKSVISIVLILLLAAFAGYYSSLALWAGDDWYCSYHSADGSELNGLCDVLSSQLFRYQDTNGRVVAHTLVQMIDAFCSHNFFAVCNALAYVMLVLMICCAARIKMSDCGLVALVVMFIVVSFRTKFVPSHQIGYIWMPILSMMYLAVFKAVGDIQLSHWRYLLLMLFGLLAGNAHEAFNIGIAGALIVYVLQNRRRITAEQWVLFFSFGAGLLLLIVSPGTLARADAREHQNIVSSVIKMACQLRVTYVLVALVIYRCVAKKGSIRDVYAENSFLLNTIAVLMLFNLVIGVSGLRQLIGIELFSGIVVLRMLKEHEIGRWVKTTVFVVFAILAVSRVCYVDSKINRINRTFEDVRGLYVGSKDGTVYYDLSKHDVNVTSLVNGEACFCFSPNDGGWMIDTMGFLLNKDTGSDKKLRILPECMETPAELEQRNHAFECAEGHFVAVLDKNNMPVRVKQKRAISVLCWEVPFKDKDVSIEGNLIYEDERVAVVEWIDALEGVKNFPPEFIH